MSGAHQKGGCLCGAVRFETQAEPKRVMACHCTTCKRRTGAAYGIGCYFDDADVTFNDGEMGEYQFHSDTSGRWIRNQYCLNCGSTVTWTLEMRPGLRALAGGSFDDPSWFDIACHIWTRSARPDMCYPPDMPVHEQTLPT